MPGGTPTTMELMLMQLDPETHWAALTQPDPETHRAAVTQPDPETHWAALTLTQLDPEGALTQSPGALPLCRPTSLQ